MRVYESAFTYFPFVYLLTMSTTFGSMYHGAFSDFQPFVIIAFMLVNVLVFHHYDRMVRSVIHEHVWRTCTLALFGILANNIHTEMLQEFHFVSDHVNRFVSLTYLVMVLYAHYYHESDIGTLSIHILFLLVPLRRVWQVNLYMYTIFVSLGIVIMFHRIRMSDLHDNRILHWRPVFRYFMYLRLHDSFIFFGPIQLYMDYYKVTSVDIQAVEHIRQMTEEMRKANDLADVESV